MDAATQPHRIDRVPLLLLLHLLLLLLPLDLLPLGDVALHAFLLTLLFAA